MDAHSDDIIQCDVIINSIEVQGQIDVILALNTQVGPDNREVSKLKDSDPATGNGAVVYVSRVHHQCVTSINLNAGNGKKNYIIFNRQPELWFST